MKSLKLTDDDIVLESGDFVFITGLNEIIQCVERALTTRLTEFFLNVQHGLDHEPFRIKNYSDDDIKTAIIECIQQDSRVSSVDEITTYFNRSDRKIQVSFKATAVDGIIEGGVLI